MCVCVYDATSSLHTRNYHVLCAWEGKGREINEKDFSPIWVNSRVCTSFPWEQLLQTHKLGEVMKGGSSIEIEVRIPFY